MQAEAVTLGGDSPGTARVLTRRVWGRPGGSPRVYLQAGLHADEMPGPLVLWHLEGLLAAAEAAGQIAGEVAVVPAANPIGLGQWINHKPQGRQELESLQNFNRLFADLTEAAGDAVAGRLGDDGPANQRLIRRALVEAADRLPGGNDLAEQRRTLLGWALQADYALDLHCDHFSVLHLYAAPARPEDAVLLARSIGAGLVLMAEVSGGNAFDEALTAPWAALARRFPDHPIPPGCWSATVEYRGQFDVDDATAAEDARRLMVWLAAIGAVSGAQGSPAFPRPLILPLGGAVEAMAPQGGIVTWAEVPGANVTEGAVIAHVTDPITRRRMEVRAPTTGILYRAELWRSCLRGQGLAHVAGGEVRRSGYLSSD